MQCYNHPQTVAVGLCKSCHKGVCHDCLVEEGYGIACKATCAEEVKALWQIIQRNKSVYQKTVGAYRRNALVYGLMALMFGLFPKFFPNSGPELRYLFFGMSGLMAIGTIMNLISASRFKKN